jgi:hypothetical protein
MTRREAILGAATAFGAFMKSLLATGGGGD